MAASRSATQSITNCSCATFPGKRRQFARFQYASGLQRVRCELPVHYFAELSPAATAATGVAVTGTGTSFAGPIETARLLADGPGARLRETTLAEGPQTGTLGGG